MADVPLLNTTASITSKTVVTAEGTATITGAHTFDRDPSAPFVVSASSAVVTNLDADKLDGEEGSAYHNAANLTGDIAAARLAAAFVWTPFTPTWTGASTNPVIGDGTLTGQYLQIGKMVFFEITCVAGSTTTFGSGIYSWALPVTAADTATGQNIVGRVGDTGTKIYGAIGVLATTSTIQVTWAENTGGNASPTVPMTWANTDYLRIGGFYEAA